MRRLAHSFAVVVVLPSPACPAAPRLPEAQTRSFVAGMETAAESRELELLKPAVADDLL
jgi:hypothetical protein